VRKALVHAQKFLIDFSIINPQLELIIIITSFPSSAWECRIRSSASTLLPFG
jgi:hypothetical protein